MTISDPPAPGPCYSGTLRYSCICQKNLQAQVSGSCCEVKDPATAKTAVGKNKLLALTQAMDCWESLFCGSYHKKEMVVMWHDEDGILCTSETHTMYVHYISIKLGVDGEAKGREDFLITTRGWADTTLHNRTRRTRMLRFYQRMKPKGRRGRLQNRGKEDEVKRKG